MKEMIAKEEFGTPYLTQVECEESRRIYVTRISSASLDKSQWRGASAEEAEEFEKQIME